MNKLKHNALELYLALLLFLALPLGIGLYLGLKGFILSTILVQIIIAILYIRKS